ncbi:hypothetical protein LSH36_23g05071 [Paralvinella palmiformis]|uniref:Ubiquitin carboxyl-terminal hydrolase n=1 Tax=Paralvinella palmiformis TaxID=53620 RepID=A0AAD9KA09_9ANNE|nr:hypothetical protein LSH36_23g05071 [Paralvinella palmiformis]
MAEGGSRDCELQKNELAELLKKPLKKGDTWYLTDTKWFKQWKKYVGYDSWDTGHVGDESAYPGPIDNSALFKESTCELLKEHLIDELDYMLLPEEAWQKLVGWYDIMEGQVPLARKVIEHGMFVKHCKVEVYLMDLKLCPNNNLDNIVTKHFSRADTIDAIEKEMRQTFHISSDKGVRLWNRYMTNTYEHLSKPDNTIQDVGLYPGQVIIIEEQNDDGTWPRQVKSTGTMSHSISSSSSSRGTNGDNNMPDTSYNSTSSRSMCSSGYYGSNSSCNSYNDGYGNTATCQPGLCGLSNLGNTCFMNSAIQCMSNVPPLTLHMLSDKWKEDLNRDNPLGMQGKIATSYAELIKNMWSGRHSYTVPRAFKTAVSQFAPQFSGYQQHDAQELMAFLLDGLHEDLNRIKNKPYVELKDADGRPDATVARESWENYLKRNDSVIVDIFHGQLKSTLVCPECDKISVTFDPFCYLTLPLPYKKEKHIKVVLVSFDPTKIPVQYKLMVPSDGTVEDLCQALSNLTDIPVQHMVVADVYSCRLHKIFSKDDMLRNIQERDDIFIYEIPPCSKDDSDMVLVHVYLREQREKSYSNYSQSCAKLFGYPLLVRVPKENCTYEVLYNHVLDRLQRFVKAPDINNEWWQPISEGTTSNGEVEMDDDNYNDNRDTADKKSSGSEEDISEEGGSSSKDNRNEHRLFKFTVVNSYGNTEVDKIYDNDKPIKFNGKTYLAADWHPQAKQQFYLEDEAKKLERHVSMDRHAKKQVIQLTDCLNLFTKEERLGEQDPWYCPQCKEFQQATKKFDLWKLPKVLVIHLKRFQFNRYRRDKLDVFVEYPIKGLDMQQWIINSEHGPALYDLKGVVNHYGGLGGGHYTAYCQNKDTRQWYHFDDSSVTKISEDAVIANSGYVLIYQRRDPSSSTSAETITNGNGNLDNEDMEIN